MPPSCPRYRSTSRSATLIGHNLGVVDAKFAEQAQLGETVGLVATDIRTFAATCSRVVGRLDDFLAGQELFSASEETERYATNHFLGHQTKEGASYEGLRFRCK